MQSRISWSPIIAHARAIATASRYALTLRGLHYRLVSDQRVRALGYTNTRYAYTRLSSLTARARRNGAFPDLADQTRRIEIMRSWSTPRAALGWLADQYARDRTEGQPVLPVLGIEKAALSSALWDVFGGYGVPIVALRGYASQTLVSKLSARVARDGRPAVLIVASDFDPSGEDIARDFIERTDCWDDVQRVALTAAQVRDYELPPLLGKAGDTRADGFIERHGELVQVELEALPIDTLIDLYRSAFAAVWDVSQAERALNRERAEQARLHDLARTFAATRPLREIVAERRRQRGG